MSLLLLLLLSLLIMSIEWDQGHGWIRRDRVLGLRLPSLPSVLSSSTLESSCHISVGNTQPVWNFYFFESYFNRDVCLERTCSYNVCRKNTVQSFDFYGQMVLGSNSYIPVSGCSASVNLSLLSWRMIILRGSQSFQNTQRKWGR